MKAVVIGTDYGREAWLSDCLKSLKNCTYPVIVLTQYRYELGKFRWLKENTSLDEFLFLHDTCVVKDPSFIDEAFAHHGSVSLCDSPNWFGMYMGKYRMGILTSLIIPETESKYDSVLYETHWTEKYLYKDPDTINLFTDLDVPEKHRFETRHGRNNLVLENDYLIKYKATWSAEQVEAVDNGTLVI